MADLSAVLRKTIDGLPKATPQLRAKVYEKARAAIARQIETANPPLPEDVVEARRSAIEDAIDRTEDHYLERDIAEATPEPAKAPVPPAQAGTPVPRAEPARADAPSPRIAPPMPARVEVPSAAPSLPHVDKGPQGPVQRPAWPKSDAPGTTGTASSGSSLRRDPAAPTRSAMPVAPAGQASSATALRADPRAASAGDADRTGARRPDERKDPASTGFLPPPVSTETRAPAGLDTTSIPAADLAAPRYANGRRQAKSARGRAPVVAGLAIILLGAGGALAYVYQDEVQTFLAGFGEGTTRTAATTGSSRTTPTAVAPTTVTAPVAATAPAVKAQSPAPAPAPAPADADAEPSSGETDVAALPPAASDATAVPPPADVAPDGAEAAAPPAATPASSARRFTQRLLPNGSEVDEGPGAGNANAFEEGTNIAAASPETLAGVGQGLAAAVPETLPPAETQSPIPAPQATVPAVPPAAAAPATTTTAALQPDSVAGVPAVAQKALFYEERSETEQGTQLGGNVVWSVVNEAPADGQPPEPAIRAVADVPEENIKMTMTIRRNADATLPASHVIELMFDVPPNFAGGQIANVQRLALKPTEEARGEPLIGVAGKISDGFFIIALNNLDQATQTNLDLMGKEQWIDIPLAYATGRRALMSIEKGIPGDRVFKEAMAAWAAKT